jgi:hypothetical protein
LEWSGFSGTAGKIHEHRHSPEWALLAFYLTAGGILLKLMPKGMEEAMMLAILVAALSQDQIDNIEYKGWAGFKPGSSVTYKYSPQKGEQKVTLVSIDGNGAVVSTEISMNGRSSPAAERKVPAQIAAGDAPKNLKKGEEEIEAGGKTLKCRTLEYDKTLPNGKTVTLKFWINDDVPGRAVQIETGTPAGKFTMTAASWDKK